MKIEKMDNMQIITPDKGKCIRHIKDKVISNKLYAPLNCDLSVYEEVYRDENMKEVFEELDDLNSTNIDIQMALIELYELLSGDDK